MSKKKLSDGELMDEVKEQMKSLRKKLRKLKRTTEEVKESPVAAIDATTQNRAEDKENAATSEGGAVVEKDASEEVNLGEDDVEAPKLNPEILAYMSAAAKSRDKHFVTSQTAVGSTMIAVAKSISLILELKEGEISSTLLKLLGNASKLLAGVHYQHSVTRRAFILPGIDKKYRELLKKSDITDDLFGKDLFKRLKHTKSMGKVVEDLTSQRQIKKLLRTSNWGNRKTPAVEFQGPLAAGPERGPTKIAAVQESAEELSVEQTRGHEVDKAKPTQSLA
ncbi:Uncharacterized protein DBV15_12767, partial [Temnothorax longispinosus]